MKVTVTVKSTFNGAGYKFVARRHIHASAKTLFLDPKLYRQREKKITGICYELEILEPNEEKLLKNPLRVKSSKKSPHLFVSFPSPMPTTWQDTVDIFRVWCGDAVLMWEHNLDCNTSMNILCKGDRRATLDLFKSGYGIVIEGAVVK